MSVRHQAPTGVARSRTAGVIAGVLALGLTAAGCTSGDADQASPTAGGSSSPSASASASPAAPVVSQASVVKNVADRGVAVDKVVKLTAKRGTFTSVRVRDGKQELAGSLSQDKTTWTSTGTLEPGRAYRARAVAVDADGVRTTQTRTFRTTALTLDQQTFPSFTPIAGQTVGVGMPVIVRFDVPVTDRAAVQRHLSVTSTSGQRGAWRWLSDSEVHWRPATYWKPGTTVTVKADINSVAVGNGVYGQVSRTQSFKIGRSVISKVNAQTHQMKTFIDGKLARTIPITTGKPGFVTRSGIKVIVEKFRHKRMNSETVGIAAGSSEAYDLDDVEYAMRVTNSGEFLHAAPWSVGQQGYANVSHGCTGMSTANAEWIYNQSKPGDVVEYTGTDRQMTLDNGYGDWNESFKDYKNSTGLS